MKKGCSFLLAILFFNLYLSAQIYDPNSPPNDYTSRSNPLYWKNRLPFAGYWQQDVYYKIKATIHETRNIIEGNETLIYTNNSPDTLKFVFFHLYQNAFVKGSHLENLNLNNNYKQKFGKYELQGEGSELGSIKINGQELATELDNTIIKVYLTEPLLPGKNVQFDITFKTYYDNGDQRRRMKMWNSYGFTHYDGVHWYPRICVYDRKLGWDTEQHLGKEFYGDFGTYDVELNFASNYVVEATGTLQNETEMLPADLRKKLDISNFYSKPWESKPSIITPYDSTQRKTWKYYAENVHDFAFTADPCYRIGEVVWNGIRVISMAQESHCAGWWNAADFTAAVIRTYSADFGMYNWPKIVVADSRDGMEYNMLTLDGGFNPGYLDLLAHEVGHNWFYGQVANNETYRAALDEGFTQFIESWCMLKLIGENMPSYNGGNKYVKHFLRPTKTFDGEVYLGYLNDAIRAKDESINQVSDGFNSALGHGGGYRHVYYKTATMLWNLQYTLGDSLFTGAMKHYFDQWKFCHPYFEDFRNSIMQYTHADLNWFFDEWMETTKTIDYGIVKVKKIRKVDATMNFGKTSNGEKIVTDPILSEQQKIYAITFTRAGRSEMPIDFSVFDKNGKRYDYYIPNTWFEKKTNATILPKWYGWDKLHPAYTAYVILPVKFKNVVIDAGENLKNKPVFEYSFIDTVHHEPIRRLADVNMLDNEWRPKARLSFDSHIESLNDWQHYEMRWRPDVWYNDIDGLKFGLHYEGDYMNFKHIFSYTIWYNSQLLSAASMSDLPATGSNQVFPFSYNLSYKTNINRFLKNTDIEFNMKDLDGLLEQKLGFETEANRHNTIYLDFKFSIRPDSAASLAYPLYPEEWDLNKWNNTITIGLKHTYAYFHGNGSLNFELRSSSLMSDYHYAYASIVGLNNHTLGKLNLKTRFIIRSGTGNPAPESALFLANASPEDLMENKYTRSGGFIPRAWAGYGSTINHFQQGGGLNLRGYAGYLGVEEGVDGNTYLIYKGNSGIAVNAELDFDGLIKFHPRFLRIFHLDTYVFGDAGSITYSQSDSNTYFSYPRMDAGIGLALTIKRFWVFDNVKPLVIRFDMPFFINSAPYAEPEYLKFRWVLGINRAF